MDLATLEDNPYKAPNSSRQDKVLNPEADLKVEYCGIGPWRPACLEPLRDIRAFIAAMCFVSCLQAAYSGYTSSQITTLEKRFAIGSIVIGVINSFFEVGYISCVMIVSYLGAKGRVPLWIACGLFAMSCGAFLFSTPQFLFHYQLSSSIDVEQLCLSDFSANQTLTESCETKSNGSYHFLPILLFAQFLIGAGSSPILTLAPPFVDDHVPPSKAPAMIASLYASAALGPVFGYALGALMLQHPMDKWSKMKVIAGTLTPASEGWIGLWWAGYIALGLGVLVSACVLIMFPRTLHSSFSPHKRSSESDVIGGSKSEAVVDAVYTDSKPNCCVIASKPLSLLASQAPPLSRQPYRQVAAYQHHQRSFSGNVPVIAPRAAPSLSAGVASQAVSFSSSRPHHQRSASVSSILLHAAIIAATASHATEEEDEAIPSESDSSWNEFTSSPDERERLNRRQSRIDQRVNESRRATRLFRSTVCRSSSLSGRQKQQQYGHRWTSTFWSSRSSSRGASQQSGGRLSRRPQNAAALDVPPPILDVMAEDSTSEVPTNPDIKSNVRHKYGDALDITDHPTSMAGCRHQPSVQGDTLGPVQSSNGNSSSPPLPFSAPAASSKSSLFVHLHGHHRRQPRKIIRGRIFGFLTDWSKDIPKLMFSLLKNKIYVVTCLCICCEMFIVIGFAGFLPKYMEIEYQISKATASIIAGGLIVPSGALGILIGGLILNKARLSRKGAVLFVFVLNFCIVGCMGSFFFLGCENPKIAGFTVPYSTEAHSADDMSGMMMMKRPWETECCRLCGCNPNVWKPVCHAETSTTYFSPCYAGCAKGPTFLPDSNQFAYHRCQCLSSFTGVPNDSSRASADEDEVGEAPQIFYGKVLMGVCVPGCKMLVPFVCFLTVLLFLTGVIQNPLLMVTMRSVGHSQRSLALGLQFVIIRLLANLPSPIAFGRAIDGACLLWKDECGRRGDCAFMDLNRLTQYITGLGVTVKGFSLLIYIVLICLLSQRCSDTLDSGDVEEVVASKLHDDNLLEQLSTSFVLQSTEENIES